RAAISPTNTGTPSAAIRLWNLPWRIRSDQRSVTNTMSYLFIDRLLGAIDRTGSPICVGIDPMLDSIPDPVRAKFSEGGDEAEEAVDTIFEFTTAVLRILAPLVPVVKFQSAYFEKYLWEGVEAYYSLVAEA